ncbi:MAG: c-type cytochrome [Woeseiaceae bacterium]
MSCRSVIRALLVLSAGLAVGAARGEGDPARGRVLAYTCMGCHGIEGYRNAYPSYRVPRLGGQKAAYLEVALAAYKAGTRPHPTMQAQGAGLTDQDIEHLAAWFAGASAAYDDATQADVAALDAAAVCTTCHGAAGQEVTPPAPVLSGQHEDYLVHALNQYRDGKRPGTVMAAFTASLSAADLAAIAAFYAAQDGLITPTRD